MCRRLAIRLRAEQPRLCRRNRRRRQRYGHLDQPSDVGGQLRRRRAEVDIGRDRAAQRERLSRQRRRDQSDHRALSQQSRYDTGPSLFFVQRHRLQRRRRQCRRARGETQRQHVAEAALQSLRCAQCELRHPCQLDIALGSVGQYRGRNSESEFFSFANAAASAISATGKGTLTVAVDGARVLNANVAVQASGNQSTVILTGSTISGNGTGVLVQNGAQVFTSQSNTIRAMAPTSAAGLHPARRADEITGPIGRASCAEPLGQALTKADPYTLIGTGYLCVSSARDIRCGDRRGLLAILKFSSRHRRVQIWQTCMQVDFFIIGVQKGGTTAIDSYLRHHPSVQMASVKEIHFFDDEQIDWSNPDYTRLHAQFDWSNANIKVRGEASPIYSYWPQAMQRLHRYSASAKLLMGLRHPSLRAYSHWRMEMVRKLDTLPFNDAIDAMAVTASAKRLRACIAFSLMSSAAFTLRKSRPFLICSQKDKSCFSAPTDFGTILAPR